MYYRNQPHSPHYIGDHFFFIRKSDILHVGNTNTEGSGWVINSLPLMWFHSHVDTIEETSQEEFEDAICKAIFDLDIYSLVKSKA